MSLNRNFIIIDLLLKTTILKYRNIDLPRRYFIIKLQKINTNSTFARKANDKYLLVGHGLFLFVWECVCVCVIE